MNNQSTKAVKPQRKQKASKPKSTVVTAPVAIGNRVTKPKPTVSALKDGVRVTNTEYIAEVTGSVNFTVQNFVVQPGNGAAFPWLCNMAPLYESYTFERLTYHFKTEKSTSTNGTVLMAVDYDASDAAPINKQQVMTYSNAVRTQPWANTSLSCPVSDLQKIKQRYVNFGVVPAGTDIKLYNVGNLFVCTQGCADTTVLGELYVEYTVVFRTPQYDPNVWASAGSNYSAGSAGITAARLLGTSPDLNIGASGMAITYNTTSGAIGFTSTGTFLVQYNVSTTAATTGTLSIAMTGGSTAQILNVAAAATLTTATFSVRILNVGDTMSFSGWTLTTPTSAGMRIASYPYGL